MHLYLHPHLMSLNQKRKYIHSVFDLTIYDFEKITLLKQIKFKVISILKMTLFLSLKKLLSFT